MSTSAKPPSAKQQRYLRSLAMQRGESFAQPATAAEASAEITRLKGRRRSTRVERALERRDLDGERARGDAAAVRDSEIVGYGSSARWKRAEQ